MNICLLNIWHIKIMLTVSLIIVVLGIVNFYQFARVSIKIVWVFWAIFVNNSSKMTWNGERKITGFYQDNALSNITGIIHEFLSKRSTNTTSQARYSSDTEPCDFFLFIWLKLPFHGQRFDPIDSLNKNLLWKCLLSIFCWSKKTLRVEEDYFEGWLVGWL